MSGNLHHCLKQQFHWAVLLISFIHLQICGTKYMQRSICPLKDLRCSFVIAHAFVTGWYLFTFFTVALLWCTSLVTLDFWLILVASSTVIWASLIGTHRSKLEVAGFIFHVVVFSRETFQTLAWKFLLCVLQKVFRVYIFPNFVLM